MSRRTLSRLGAVRGRDLRAGAGGGAAPFDPLSIDGLELWLDAQDDDTITESPADLVSAWDDKSPAGNDVVQVQKPDLITVGGLQCIDFQTADRMQRTEATGITGLDGPDMTLFVVGHKPAFGGTFWAGAINRSNTGWTTGWRMFAGDGTNMYFSAKDYNNDQALISSTPTPAAGFHIWAGDHLGSSGVKHGYLNNELAGTDTSGDVSTVAGNTLFIGNSNPAATYSLMGAIGEILCYNSVLSESDRLAVSEYLAEKWAITLP